MKQYLKQVMRELNVPRKRKKEILRDLLEAFSSAIENGETEHQVIERLGLPKELANSIEEQLGYEKAKCSKKITIVGLVFTVVIAIFCFVGFFICKQARLPQDIIGQGDALTNIQMDSPFIIDISFIILAIGIIALIIAIVQIICILLKSKNGRKV